jgi:hypothetical protein
MCGIMLRDQLFGKLNPTIGYSIESFQAAIQRRQQSTTYTITTQQKVGLLPLWRPFGHSPGVLGAGNPP